MGQSNTLWPIFIFGGFMANKNGVMLRAAQAYSDREWKVFRLSPESKVPLPGTKGHKDATDDDETLISWFRDHDELNIGLAAGDSDIVVIDIDGTAGAEAMERWESENGAMPRTATQITGSGGSQRFYRVPDGMTIPCRQPWMQSYPHIDVKSVGGYVVLPPSIHPNGRNYQWHPELHPTDVGVTELTGSALEFILAAQREPKVTAPRDINYEYQPGMELEDDLPAFIPIGQRDSAMTVRAGLLRRYGATDREIEEDLAIFVTERCEDGTIDWPEWQRSIRRVARSAMSWEPDEDAISDVELRRRQVEKAEQAARAAEERRAEMKQGDEGLIETWEEWDKRMGEDEEVIIPGILHQKAVALLAAPPKTGKTWLALDMALAVSNGTPFLSRYPVTAPGKVLYVATEGSGPDTKARIRSLGLSHNTKPSYGGIDFLWRRNLRLDDDDQRLMTLLNQEDRWRLIILDVFGDVWSGEENSSKEVRHIMSEVRKIADHTSVLCVMHTTKVRMDAGTGYAIRGSGAFYGALDDGIYLDKTDDETRAICKLETRSGRSAQPSLFDFSFPDFVVTGIEPVSLTWLEHVEPESKPKKSGV